MGMRWFRVPVGDGSIQAAAEEYRLLNWEVLNFHV
jgi:hypothetical protein